MLDVPRIDIRPDHWEIVRGILEKHVPQHAVWAFGSRAKWTAKQYSDLDLAVISDKPLSLAVMASLSDDFSESDLPYKVDVVDWATTSESFRKVIERDKVVVQEAGRGWGMSADSVKYATPTGELIPLSDVANVVGGYAFKSSDFGSCGMPVVKIANIEPPRVNIQSCERIPEEKLSGLDRFRLAKGDILMAMTGATVGKVGRIRDHHSAYLNQRVAKISSKIGPEYNDFIFALLSQKGFEEKILNNSSGSAQANVSADGIGRVLIPALEPSNQLKVGKFTAAIDDKIDLNRRINQTLEAMAQAIFKSWFVDFDPVKAKIAAKAEGRDPLRAAMSAISGKADAELDVLPPEQYEQLAATAALFPDEMEESGLGAIPKGWEVQRVGALLELAYGKALKSTDRQEGNVPVYGSGGITGYHSTALVPNTSIVVGRKGTVGSLYWEDEPFFPIDTTYFVRPLTVPLTYCYYAMRTLGLEKMNTDAAVPGLNRENVYRLELVRPDSPILKRFDSDVLTLRKTIRVNSDSSKSLANLRDTLLPKLLSGELLVSGMMAEVEI